MLAAVNPRPAGIFTTFTEWRYIGRAMKRATVAIPDDLAKALGSYIRDQEVRPALTAVIQSALRQYLMERGYLRAAGPLRITPARRGSGHRDTSEAHDRFLAGQ
jgi:hypothetical protein